MCAVSFVSDHFKDKWPVPNKFETFGPIPGLWKPPPYQITKEQWEEYQALKAKAAAYDVATKQPDCVKPENDEWERRMEAYLIKRGIIIKNG